MPKSVQGGVCGWQGAVYTAYGIFVITLIPKFKNIEDADSQGNFPGSWAKSGVGKFG